MSNQQVIYYYFRQQHIFFKQSITTMLLMLLISLQSGANTIDNHSDSDKSTVSDWINTSVKSGDNLSVIFKRVGLSAKDALEISQLTKTEQTFIKMIPGESLAFLIVEDKLKQIRYAITKTITTVLSFNDNADRVLITREVKPPADVTIQPVIATAAPKSTSDIKQPAIQDKALKAVDPSQYSQIQRQTFTVSRGDSLTSLFLKAGMTASDVINVINSNTHTAKADNAFTHLALGDSISFLIVDGALLELKRATSTNHVFTALKALGTKNTYLISQVEPQPISGATNKLSVEAAIHQTSTPADNWVYYTVQADDNLSTLFFRAGLSATDVHYVSNVAKKDATFNRMLANEKVAFLIRDSHLIKMKYIINQFKSVVFTRLDKANYQIEVLERKPVISQKKFAGSITNSLFVDALNAGLSSNMVMNFAKIFAWDIDFSQDIQPGDEFKLVYEEKTIDGSKFENGNIIAAQFTTGGQDLIGIFYRDSMGDVGFYTPEGRSMRKAFLRMPVELARISSKFNPRRLHPISKTVRPHRGVDYAAKSGTPIMASGNGKIVHLGRKGNYGKTIVIQHGTSINTLYAHMSGYYKDLKVGSRVTQGQVIGYIGATGAVTGPHLHYEFRVDGVHKNPLTVKLPKAISLDPTEKKAFSIVAQAALKQLNFAPSDPSIPEKLAINGINTAHEKP